MKVTINEAKPYRISELIRHTFFRVITSDPEKSSITAGVVGQFLWHTDSKVEVLIFSGSCPAQMTLTDDVYTVETVKIDSIEFSVV